MSRWICALVLSAVVGCGGSSRAAPAARADAPRTAAPGATPSGQPAAQTASGQTASAQTASPQTANAQATHQPAHMAPAPQALYADDPDAAVRRAIDERASALLGCTEGAVTAVDLSWTIEGDIEVSLTGRMAGTPAEGCAQRSLADIPIPSGEAGAVRHPIRVP